LAALLLLANLVFFVWSLGWLDSLVGTRARGDREPERLARQVRPETIRIVRAGKAGEAATAIQATAPACLEAGPFGDADIGAAQAVLQAALPAGSWVDLKVEQPAVWMVYIGRYASRDGLTKKAEELQRRQLPYDEVRDRADLAPGLALGRFDQRGAATRALEQFTAQGLRGARVVEFAPASTRHVLRIDKPGTALAAQVAALKADALGSGFAPCAKP
jgi:hypothetical protein